MRLQQWIPWHKETAIWVLGLFIVLLIGTPLVAWSAAEVRAQTPVVANAAKVPQKEAELTALLSEKVSLYEFISPQATIGRSDLELNALAQAHSISEADNVRWSLVRRTPQAAEVYQPETGVDWEALRRVQQVGTIFVPADFPWSFNQTFQQGPGYKEAGGILAGGHCALATVFRAAAVQAGLPVTSRQHATPIPGFSLQESVNILWGRDDLIVHNNSGQDLYFIWAVDADHVTVAVVPVADAVALPPLPDWRGATVAMVYGRPSPGGWGSLGQAVIVDHALHVARTFAGRVDEWNGTKPVAVAANPNVVMAGKMTERDLHLYHLIAEARRQGYYVMLDVQTGDAEPLPLFQTLMDKYLRDNVWFDWDIEHTAGGQVDAAQINQVAAEYFARRKAHEYQTPGIFGFYVFKKDQITNPTDVRRQYEGGVVVPIFDGFGGSGPNPGADKIALTARVLSLFGQGSIGVMEFETRWGTKYDKISARDYFEAYPDALIFASQ